MDTPAILRRCSFSVILSAPFSVKMALWGRLDRIPQGALAHVTFDRPHLISTTTPGSGLRSESTGVEREIGQESSGRVVIAGTTPSGGNGKRAGRI